MTFDRWLICILIAFSGLLVGCSADDVDQAKGSYAQCLLDRIGSNMNEEAITVVQSACLRRHERKVSKELDVQHDPENGFDLTVSNNTSYIITQFSVARAGHDGWTYQVWIEPGKWYGFSVSPDERKQYLAAVEQGKINARSERGLEVISN